MKKIHLFAVGALFLVLCSCGGGLENKAVSGYMLSYLKDKKDVVVFGKMDVQSILDKAAYKEIPKVSALMIPEVKQYAAALDLKQGFYFAVEGPFDRQGNPKRVVGFAKVKNLDSLENKVASLGQMIQEDGDMKYAQDNDVTIGMTEQVAIFVSSKENYDGKVALNEILEQLANEEVQGKAKQILSQKGDIIFGTSFENLYQTANTDLNKLDDVKKKEMEALVKDSYIQSAISFDQGQAVFESKNLFSSSLANRLFLKEDASGSIVKKLGGGNAYMGFSMNVDVKKMENFLNDFTPGGATGAFKNNFMVFMAMKSLGENPLSQMFSGQLGLAMTGNLNMSGMIPDATLFVGYGSNASANGLLEDIFKSMMMSIQKTPEGIIVSSKPQDGSLKVPSFASDFGKKGLTAYVNFKDMDMKSLDLDAEAKGLEAIEYVWLSADNSGSKMIVKGRDASKNILKQIVDVYINDAKAMVGGVN